MFVSALRSSSPNRGQARDLRRELESMIIQTKMYLFQIAYDNIVNLHLRDTEIKMANLRFELSFLGVVVLLNNS